jgi:hypothetical protein
MWTVYAHEDHPEYLSINNGGNDTLLKTSDGRVDQERASAFAEWVTTLARVGLELATADVAGNGDEYDDPEGVNSDFWAALSELREIVTP